MDNFSNDFCIFSSFTSEYRIRSPPLTLPENQRYISQRIFSWYDLSRMSKLIPDITWKIQPRSIKAVSFESRQDSCNDPLYEEWTDEKPRYHRNNNSVMHETNTNLLVSTLHQLLFIPCTVYHCVSLQVSSDPRSPPKAQCSKRRTTSGINPQASTLRWSRSARVKPQASWWASDRINLVIQEGKEQ